MTLKDLVKAALNDGGFDGLWNSDAECACKADDLFPCGQPSEWCQAGHLLPCDCGEHDFHIGKRSTDIK